MNHRKKILVDADFSEQSVEDAIEQLYKYLQEEKVKTFAPYPSALSCVLKASLFAYEPASKITFMNACLNLELNKDLPQNAFEVSYSAIGTTKNDYQDYDTYTIYSKGCMG